MVFHRGVSFIRSAELVRPRLVNFSKLSSFGSLSRTVKVKSLEISVAIYKITFHRNVT